MPPMLIVAPAAPEDYAACARLFADLEVPDPVWDEDRFIHMVAPDTVVLREGDAVRGYAWARPRGDALHVVHVVVDRSHRGRGAGRLLMATLAARARALGFSRWLLNVKPENLAARALYERCGMAVAFASASLQLDWSNVPRLEARAGARGRELSSEDDSAFERAFGLSKSEIAPLRETQGRILLGVEDESGPAAFGAFEPRFPGIAPMRVRAPAYARALLETARPYALEGQTYVRMFAEGDPTLEGALTQ